MGSSLDDGLTASSPLLCCEGREEWVVVIASLNGCVFGGDCVICGSDYGTITHWAGGRVLKYVRQLTRTGYRWRKIVLPSEDDVWMCQVDWKFRCNQFWSSQLLYGSTSAEHDVITSTGRGPTIPRSQYSLELPVYTNSVTVVMYEHTEYVLPVQLYLGLPVVVY